LLKNRGTLYVSDRAFVRRITLNFQEKAMSDQKMQLSREELYALIWKTPMRQLAQELGMSDVGLRKLCHRNGIPTPPQGFHLMKSGPKKSILKKSLPSIEEGQRSSFIFKVTDVPKIKEISQIESQWDNLLTDLVHVRIKDKKVIKQIIRTLLKPINKNKTDERGILLVPDASYPIRVSPEMLAQAVELYEQLLERMFALGATLLSIEDKGSSVLLKVDWLGYVYRFQIAEYSTRSENPKRNTQDNRYYSYHDRWIYTPTGRLSLEIWGPGYGANKTQDGKRLIIDRIDEVLRKQFFKAYEQKKEHEIKEIRKQKALRHLQKKELTRQEEEFQALRKKKLFKDMRVWQRAKALREYIDAIEDHGVVKGVSEGQLEEWLAWARNYADSLDPIKQRLALTDPPFPEGKEIIGIPWFYLEYDDPEEAERDRARKPYW